MNEASGRQQTRLAPIPEAVRDVRVGDRIVFWNDDIYTVVKVLADGVGHGAWGVEVTGGPPCTAAISKQVLGLHACKRLIR